MNQSKEINCLHCGQPNTEIIRLTEKEKGNRIRTLNTTKICTNPQCWSYLDIKKVKNWRIK